jgi:hypothetical protein
MDSNRCRAQLVGRSTLAVLALTDITSRNQERPMNQRCTFQNPLMACSLLCLLLVTGCASGPTIRSNVDPGANFHAFRTFSFFQPLSTDREGYQSLISQQLIASAQRELEARGLTRDDTRPDLLVNFNADLDERLRVTQMPAPATRGFNRHRHGLYSTWPTYQRTEIRQYTRGTLGIDVVDAARRQLVWEGFAFSRVTQSTTNNLGPVLNDAVVEIFREFPLPPR